MVLVQQLLLHQTSWQYPSINYLWDFGLTLGTSFKRFPFLWKVIRSFIWSSVFLISGSNKSEASPLPCSLIFLIRIGFSFTVHWDCLFSLLIKMFLKPVWEVKMHGVTKIGVFSPLFCVGMLGKSTNYSAETRPLCSTFWAK